MSFFFLEGHDIRNLFIVWFTSTLKFSFSMFYSSPNKIGSRVSLLAFIHFYPPFPPPSSIWSSLYRYIDIDLQKQAPISIYRHTFLYRYIFPLMLFIWSAVLWRSALTGNLLPDVEDWVLWGCYVVPVGSTPPKEAPTWTKSVACLMACYRCSLNATVVLLWILQDASMPEIIDVTAEKNQLRISVLWHLAMGRGGILFRRRNHHRFLAWNPFHATLCQGTKSARQPRNDASAFLVTLTAVGHNSFTQGFIKFYFYLVS